MTDFRNILFESYLQFKSWEMQSTHPDAQEIFEIETAPCHLPTNAQIYEIGFGQGDFLIWAQQRGYQVKGTELIPELVERAKQRGIEATLLPIQGLANVYDEKNIYDLIATFDLLEHLHVEEILQFLQYCSRALKPGGVVLIRVPNGQSPFGRIYQYGDMTHVSVLSADRMAQLAQATGLELHSARNAARPLGKKIHTRIARKLIYFLRDCLGYGVARIFWGRVLPMDPNLTIILKKPIR